MLIPFAKYQALGNSFIVLDRLEKKGRSPKLAKLARQICSPAVGVGADGLMVASREGKRLRFDIYNADGSWAEKSGNGVRIAAMHFLNAGQIHESRTEVVTGSDVSCIGYGRGSSYKRVISASLGKPEFRANRVPLATAKKHFINQPIDCGGQKYLASAVAIGNPHLILFCDNFDFDWKTIGKSLEKNRLFPHRINVGFVIVRNQHTIEVRDWERGVGPTESSGTGAAAAVAVSIMRGFTGRRVKVKTLAGTLGVFWDTKSDEITIEGPVEFIGKGEFFCH